MEAKKISFGFMKTKKVERAVAEEKKEFIECMEEKSIKVVGGEEVKEAAPLVIPMKPNTLVTAERLKQIADEVETALNEPDTTDKSNSPAQQIKAENESLDQMAVRELLEDAKKEVKIESKELTLPVSKTVVEVQKESTLEDYEDVPIQDFGLAMLRGMGWTPSKEQSKYKQPQLRPKGLGLGADKVVTEKQKKKASTNEKGEELTIVKNSFVKITAGKHSGYYGKVISLDEDNGRVMVDITIKKETVSLSEFMMQPVTKAEFDKESKVINADSFDEYKKSEKVSQKPAKYDSRSQDEASSSKHTQDVGIKDNRTDRTKSNHTSHSDGNSGGRSKPRRDSSSSDEKSYRRKKSKKKYSSNDSLSSISDSDRKNKHKSSRRRYSSSDSDSDSPKRDKRKRTPVKKRDIDKKRKGKKKKRDRDRSPHHYKKHRK